MFNSLLMALLMSAGASKAADDALVTRFGKLEARSTDSTTTIVYKGEAVLKIAADNASMLRVSSTSGHEFVIVQAWRPGLHCHHTFWLLELADKAKPIASEAFGECMELDGAGWLDGAPVVHLKTPFIDASEVPRSLTSYQWRQGELRTVFESADPCKSAAFEASTLAANGAPPVMRKVAGPGRLDILSAPSANCRQAGLFIIPGDLVATAQAHGAYVFATYTHPKTGKKTEGWLLKERLGAPGE